MRLKLNAKQIRWLVEIASISAVYYVAARFSLLLSFQNTNASPVWLPSGIGFAAVLLRGFQIWPAITIGAFLANAITFLTHGTHSTTSVFISSFFISCGNTMEAILGVLLLDALIGRNPLYRIQDVIKFIFVTMAMCLASASIGSMVLYFTGIIPWNFIQTVWLTWWVGDTSGVLTLSPLFFYFYQNLSQRWGWKRFMEMILSLSAAFIISFYIFSSQPITDVLQHSLTYIVIPLIVWMAFRFGQNGVGLTMISILGVAIIGTTQGLGPFTREGLNESLILLQGFVVFAITTGLILSASLTERKNAEEKLSKREQWFRAMIENNADVITLLDPAGVIVYTSPSTTRILGYTAEEYLGRNIFEFIHPDDVDFIMERFKEVLEKPENFVAAECRYRHKDGSWRWLEGSGNNLLAEESIKAVVVNCRDITERKTAQQRFEQVVESSPNALVMVNEKGKITLVNSQAERLFDYKREEMIGQSIELLVPQRFHGSHPGHREQFLQKPETRPMGAGRDLFGLRKDGKEIPVEIGLNPMKTEEGTFILASIVDITERKRADAALRVSEERFRTLANNAPVGIFLTDTAGHCLYVNPQWCEMAGLSPEEAKKEGWVKALHPEDGSRILNEWYQAEKAGKEFFLDYRFRTPEGKVTWVSGKVVALYNNGGGEASGYLGTVTDITERMQAQEHLRLLKDRLEIEKLKVEQVLGIEEGLNTILDADRLVDFIVEKSVNILEAEKCSLMLVDNSSRELCIKGHNGLNEDIVRQNRIRIGDSASIAGRVAQEGQPVLVTNIEKDPYFARENGFSYKTKSCLIVPIKIDRHLLGVICVADKKGGGEQTFSRLDLKILAMISRQAAVAIENAKLYRELKHLTIMDPMTDLYNYRYFAKTLDHEINRLKRYSGSLCLLMMDIDDFKNYNDTYGHLEGDVLLRSIAKILKENLRDVDIPCRYAGDEFVVILPEANISQAMRVADKIIEQVKKITLITVSIGIAAYFKDSDRYDLILKADTALYNAKKEGKNKVVILT